MGKAVVAGLIGVIALAAITGVVISNNPNDSSRSTNTAMQSTDTGTNNDANMPNTVIAQGFDFKTKKLTIKKGVTVTWINKDDAKHDITPDNPSSDFTASPLFGKNESYSFTFNKPGTYTYFCSPHPYMKAAVEVTE